ncbi:MAG: T9SS type A sorting domain-containing protein [Bacteroidales bacterium]|jgi:hypothetical protein|nr:T9SS type A sorting domain-containing protein [Bacteroidales bacterium]
MKKQYILTSGNIRALCFFFAICWLLTSRSFAQTVTPVTVNNAATFISALGGIDKAYCASVSSSGEYEIILTQDIAVSNPITIESGHYYLSTENLSQIIQYTGSGTFITIGENAALRIGSDNPENQNIIFNGTGSSARPYLLSNSGTLTIHASGQFVNFDLENALINHIGGSLNLDPGADLNEFPIRLSHGSSLQFNSLPTHQTYLIQFDTLRFCTPYIVLNQPEESFTEADLSVFQFQLPDMVIPYMNADGRTISFYNLIIDNDIDTCFTYYDEVTDSIYTESTSFYKYDDNNCQNIHFNKFTIKQNYSEEITKHVCEAALPFIFDTLAIYVNGTYTLHYDSKNYCDSSISIHVIVEDERDIALSEVICENKLPYFMGDSAIYNAGIHQITFINQWGCDSVVTLNLSITPSTFRYDTISICASEVPYDYRGNSLSEAGDFLIYSYGSTNCDSIINVHVTIHPQPAISISGNKNACVGDTLALSVIPNSIANYSWNNGNTGSFMKVYTAGTYFVTATDTNGCSAMNSIDVTFSVVPNPNISKDTELHMADQVVITVTGALDYQWNSGDSTAVITVFEEGTYVVTASTGEFCSRVDSIIIHDYTPQLEITGDQSICAGETVTLSVVDVKNTGTSFIWSTGMTGNSITVTPSSDKTYGVTGTNSHSVSATAKTTVSICDINSYKIIGDTVFCQNSNHALTIPDVTSCVWSTGETTSTIHVNEAGEYRVTFTTPEGCVGQDSLITTTMAKPTVGLYVSGSTTFCEGGSVILQADGGVNYFWNTGESTRNISTSNFGKYIVTVTAVNGCTDTISQLINILPLPSVTFSVTEDICLGQQAVIEAHGNTGNTYRWSTGETSSMLISNPAQNSIYRVTATSAPGCAKEFSFNITVHALPSVSILGSSQICQGDTTTISASGAISYLWSSGETTPDINIHRAGTYYVTATGEGGCTNVFSHQLTTILSPNANIAGSSSFCQGGNTLLTASGGNSYVWSTGANTASITVSQGGNYAVTVTNNNGCESTKAIIVTVNPSPSPSITGQENLCVGSTAVLTAHGGASYRWSNNATTSSIAISESGVYYVTVSTDLGCEKQASFTVVQRALPTAAISGETNICQGASTILTASGGSLYNWSTGSVATEITTNQAGTYSVTVGNEYGCSTTATRMVTVNALPNFTISGNSTFCQGSSTPLTASGEAGLTYFWQSGETTPSLTVTTSGTYSVTATNAHNCISVQSKSVTTHSAPTASITGSQSICPGTSTTLTANGGTSYLWSNGITTAENTISPTGATTYTVTVTNANNCTAMASIGITINPTPTVTLSGNTFYCAGSSTVITAQGGTSFHWSNGDINASTTISAPGLYTVTVTNGLGCSQSSSTNIIENPLPNTEITGTSTICLGETTILTSTGGNSYSWATGQNSAAINATPTQNTSYSVTATNEYNCTASASITLTVNPLPEVAISGSNWGCIGDTVTLTVLGTDTYIWNTGVQGNVQYATLQGTYIVTATNEQGCMATATKEVTFHTKPTPSIMGNTTFCDGNQTALTAGGGVSYQWSNGTSDATVTVGDANTYTVTVTNAEGCTATTSTTTSLLASPDITIAGNRPLCQGETNTLYATGGVAYVWNDGSTGNSLTISPSGSTTYAVTATNHLDCSASQIINVVVNPSYAKNVADEICIGNTYQRNGFSLPVQESAGVFTHVLDLTTAHGCDSTVTLTLTVNPKPVITESITGNEFISFAGNYTYIINNVQHADAYQWSVSNPSWQLTQSSSKNVVLSINSSGSGTLTVLAVNNCGLSESTSITISSTVVGIDEYEDDNIDIFPNPASDYIKIKNVHPFPIDVEIYDMNGKLIIQTAHIEGEIQISTHNFASGNYIIRIFGENKIMGSRKMVKI